MPTYVVTGPDGAKYRVTAPEGATAADVQARVQQQAANKPTSFWQGFGEGLQKPAANAARLLTKTNPLLNVLDTLTGAPSKAVDRAERGADAARSRSRYRGSTAGNIVGGVVGTLPTALLPGGAIAQGAASGAMMSEDTSPLTIAKNAVIGGVAGKAGQLVGKYGVAPIAERLGRTRAARAAAKRVVDAVNRVAPGKAKMLPSPNITKPDRTVMRMSPEMADVRQNVMDAQRLGLPYALADASPEMRALAGSVSRKSSEASALAERTFAPRARGQADRAVSAIDERLAPITDIEQRAAEIRQSAQNASRPFYDEARSRAAPVDDDIAGMLQTPAGKDALRRAYVIAQNEGRDPKGIGFDLDDQGEVFLRQEPTFETLQLVKQSLGTQLDGYRNQITGKLDLEGNRDAQSVANLLERFNTRLGEINQPYREGNAAYAAEIARRGALNLGKDTAANNVPQRQFDTAMSRQNDVTMPEFQRGYATSMADAVERQRLTSNPYETVYGSPLQQQKVGQLFPEGADDFRRVYDLESEMSKTAWETLGGSPTQRRAMADQLFDAKVANAGGVMIEAAANPKLAALKAVSQKLQDTARTKSEANAAELAPRLFDTQNPMGILDYIDELAKKRAEEEVRKHAYQRSSGLLGIPVAAGAAGFTNP